MFGCLRRIGCVIIIAVALLAAWYWYARVDEPAPTPTRTTRVGGQWEPLTPDGAERARMALESLSDARGPGSVFVSGGDLASYIFFSSANRLPATAQDVEAAVIGDQLAVRAVVPLKDLGAGQILGPLVAMLDDSDSLQFSGTLRVLQSEIGQYRVKQLQVAKLRIPAGLIPRILRQIDRGDRPAGVPPDALVLPIPPYVGDIRVGEGRIMLSKQAR